MSTSSQLATTTASGCAITAPRSARSMELISPTRSNWSRVRFRRTNAFGCRRSATLGTCSSSHSSTMASASLPARRAEMMPASMLSPPSLVATVCFVRTAPASMRVVVDLPLVPVTSTVGRPPPREAMMLGSIAPATRPPIMPPAPRPVAREAAVARLAAVVARRARAREMGPCMRTRLLCGCHVS